jgi:hypothetical protein
MHTTTETCTGSYWLLLQCVIVQSNCSHLLIYCVSIWFLIIPDSSTTSLANTNARHLVAKQGETWRQMSVKYLCHTLQGSLTCCKILQHGDHQLCFPPKGSTGSISSKLCSPKHPDLTGYVLSCVKDHVHVWPWSTEEAKQKIGFTSQKFRFCQSSVRNVIPSVMKFYSSRTKLLHVDGETTKQAPIYYCKL